MEKEKLKGAPLDITDLNLMLYGQMDPDVPQISVSEYLELWPNAMNVNRAKLRAEMMCPIQIFSTADSNCGKGFKEIWEDTSIEPISNEEFSKQVEEVSKFYNADIYDTCGTCGKLAKNNVCENCKASNTQIES